MPVTPQSAPLAIRESDPDDGLGRSIVERFSIVADRRAPHAAICEGATTWTYADVASLMRAIATAVRDAPGDRDAPIAVLLGHEARYPACILGVLAAGRIVVPLDATHPIERNRQIAAHAGVAAVVTCRDLAADAATLFGDVPLIVIEACRPARRLPAVTIAPDDVACVIYTSGSTGSPKGVYQDHQGVLHDILQSISGADIRPTDRLAAFYSPTVIAGFRVTLSALLSGASLVVLPPAVLGPDRLAAALATGVTIVRCTPTLFRHVAGTLAPGQQFTSLRLVLLGGERVEWSDVAVCGRACGSHARLGVHLGATECWTVYADWIVDRSERGVGRLPVGRPVPHRSVWIVGDDGRIVADGEVGESVVGGRHLARGYWRDPDLTARAFVAPPDGSRGRAYRTGDLVVRRPDGLLEHVGRRDQQIKLAGRRVEPAEIETALRQCGGVADAAVVVRRASSGAAQSLAAYVEARPDAPGLLPRHVKAQLSQRVPRHMVPATLTLLERLPRLPTFKIDRVQLADLDRQALEVRTAPATASSTEAVAKVFEEVLGISGAGIDDTLWSLGGDSLQAITVAAKLESRFGIRVPLDTFESAESIRQLAAWIERERRSGERAAGTAVRATTSREARLAARQRRTISEWSAAVDRLFRAGDLESAQREAERLHTAFPRLPYSDRLVEILHRIPSAGGYLPVDDDEERDVHIVRRTGADTTVFLFCGNRRNLGVPLPAIHQWFARWPATLVYLRDPRRRHFFSGLDSFGPDRAAMVAVMREIAGSSRVVCWGTSSGAIAALHCGLDLGAEAVVGLAGPLNFAPEFNRYLRASWLVARLRATAPESAVDIRGRYADAARTPRTLLVYGDNNWDDRLHAEYMHGLPTVDLLPLQEYREHNVTTELIARDWFDRLVAWAMTPAAGPLPDVVEAPARASGPAAADSSASA